MGWYCPDVGDPDPCDPETNGADPDTYYDAHKDD
jgi:hypothetical protein